MHKRPFTTMADQPFDLWSFFLINTNFFLLLSNIILVIITGIYVYLTKKILESTKKEIDLSYSPVIGIQIQNMTISPVWGDNRRDFTVNLNLVNLGNAPAIRVWVDSAIILKFTDVSGEKIIPTRLGPAQIPFIRQGDSVNGGITAQFFGNTCISKLIFDFLQEDLKNRERLQSNSNQEPIKSSKLKIFVYYKNHLDQYFMSTYETYIMPTTADGIPIPGFVPTPLPMMPAVIQENQTIEVVERRIPTPRFFVKPIEGARLEKEMSERDKKRNLCGS
jgi:hypothetical protein